MLYIVPTPIGNLKDITLRALEVLKMVDCIAAEDTRHTGILLKHFEIPTKMVSFHSHSSDNDLHRIIGMLQEGKNVALVSDAGMPGISDPGYVLIKAVCDLGLPMTVLPGPSAFTAAVVASGLPSHRFLYLGFLPLKKGRKTLFESVKESPYTLVFYEAPHRIQKTLADCGLYFGEARKVAVCREISKIFEEVFRGSVAEARAHFEKHKPRGEFSLVIAPAGILGGDAAVEEEPGV